MWSREPPAIPSSITVIKDSANGYFLNFVVEVLPEVLPKTDNSVGIDLGIKTKASCRDVLLTQSSANATRHVCAAFRQENAFLLCNVPTR